MHLNFATLWQFLFPPSEDEMRITSCTKEVFASKLSPVWAHTTIRGLASFSDPHVRAAIHLAKFHNHSHAISLLSSLCVAYFNSLPANPYIAIPVPLSKARLRTRGYNQVTRILETALTNCPNITLIDDVLIRTRNTPPQTTLTHTQRLHNLKGAFSINSKKVHTIQNCNIILLDDVCTTGATLQAAHAALTAHNATSVVCVALAH
jgi:ComF family protein